MATSTAPPAMAATSAARKRLITAHQDEYDGYLREERVNRGLPAVSGLSIAKLQERKERLEKQLAKVNQKLNNR